MPKRLSLLIAICAWVLPLPAVALDAVPITLLPFQVYAQAPLSHLQKEIPDILGKHLSQEGAQLVAADLAPAELETLEALNVADRRQIAARVGAGHVIWGSLTLVGEQFSLTPKWPPPPAATRRRSSTPRATVSKPCRRP